MEEITTHKLRFSLDEVRKALNITEPIESIYHSVYLKDPYIEFVLGDKQ